MPEEHFRPVRNLIDVRKTRAGMKVSYAEGIDRKDLNALSFLPEETSKLQPVLGVLATVSSHLK